MAIFFSAVSTRTMPSRPSSMASMVSLWSSDTPSCRKLKRRICPFLRPISGRSRIRPSFAPRARWTEVSTFPASSSTCISPAGALLIFRKETAVTAPARAVTTPGTRQQTVSSPRADRQGARQSKRQRNRVRKRRTHVTFLSGIRIPWAHYTTREGK